MLWPRKYVTQTRNIIIARLGAKFCLGFWQSSVIRQTSNRIRQNNIPSLVSPCSKRRPADVYMYNYLSIK